MWPGTFSEVTISQSVLVFSEGLVVALILIRKRTDYISINPRDWFVAFSGTFLPLLVTRGGDNLIYHFGIFLMIFGLITHVYAKLSLFRSFGVVPANRGVKVKGLYAIVRHPMYAGYLWTHIGYLLSAASLWNLGVYICVWFFMLLRIFAEENLLSQSSEYQKYRKSVRYRLIPGIF